MLMLLCAPATLFHARAQEIVESDRAVMLALPPSAALLGRGTVSSFGAMNASDIYRFTTNSAFADGTQFILGQTAQNGGERNIYGAAALPVFYTGTLGFFAQNVSSEIHGASTSFGFSLAKYSSEYRYGVGGHLSLLRSGVFDGADYYTAFGVDFRIDPSDALSARTYYISSGVPLSSSVDDMFADQYGFIMNYSVLRGRSDFWGLDLGAGAQKTWDVPLILGASAELNAGGRFFARLGYENSVGGEPNISRLNAGLGFLIGGFGIDGAYSRGWGGGSGEVYAVNAKYHIESLKKRNAADNFALAQKYFERGRFQRSSLYSNRTLALDSTQWNAQALLYRSEMEFRRERWNDIAIIYGGNARGMVVPFPPSLDALGGLSRYAAVVESLRETYPVNFTVDVGNILSSENNQLRVELAAVYYDLMNFDMIAPGKGEIEMGPFHFAAAQKRRLPFVMTNLNDNDSEQSGIWSTLMLTNDGYSVYMINLLDRSAIGDNVRLNFDIDVGNIRSLLTGRNAAGADLRVAVIHGNLEEIKRLAAALPELHVIIAGSLEERFETPLRVGQTLIVSAGAENRFVGCLAISFDNPKNRRNRASITNRLYPVFQDIAPHPAVESATGLVSAAIKVERSGESDRIPVRVRGVISHLSERGDGTQAFNMMIASGDWPDVIFKGDIVKDAARYMDEGVVIEYGTPEDVMDNPSSDRMKRFLERYAP
ncbi:MAG: hypothetical protein LBC70_02395 [Chitinispirillales bacterium]|nr:hypothetical protein [Chitinispirillales bacterium]